MIRRCLSVISSRRHRAFFLGLAFAIAALLALWLHSYPWQNRSPIYVAVPADLSGEEVDGGQERLRGVNLYLETVNEEGGIQGHPIQALSFDDRNDPASIKELAPKIIDSPALVVLGHRTSTVSLAASPFYQKHHLPAISPTATANNLTDNPYYFRGTSKQSTIAKVEAIYAQQVLKFKKASILRLKDEAYGQFAADDFIQAFTTNGGIITSIHEVLPNAPEASMQGIVEQLASQPKTDLIFLATRDVNQAAAMVAPIRQRGLNITIIGSEPLAQENWIQQFQRYPEEQKQHGFFTKNLYIFSSISLDSAGADAQDFADLYAKRYGELPSYLAIKSYEAAMIAVEALRHTSLDLRPESLDRDRDQVYRALQKLNNPQRPLFGLTGPLYFNADRGMDHLPISMVQFEHGKLISAPEQLTSVVNIDDTVIQQELKTGNMVQIGNDYFWRQLVVYTGIDINQLIRVDQKASSFTAAFYLWLRYQGDIKATEEVIKLEFPGGKNLIANQPLFSENNPIETSKINGLNYRLYEVRGEFKNEFDLRDYPFDQQDLTIRLQNSTTPTQRLIYVVDSFGLQLPRKNQAEDQAHYSLPLWQYQGIQYAKEIFRTSSTEGNPRLFNSNNQTDYPGLRATITVQRKSFIFLIKNLLPLVFLVLVLMMTLFFPARLTNDRCTVSISALISGTVFLVGVYNQLPEIGYIAAIEYIFYIFFGLSLFSIVVGILTDHLLLQKNTTMSMYLNWSARAIYITVILATALTFWTIFGGKP